MPVYITQGRYTREAIKGMLKKPEDRAEAVSRTHFQDLVIVHDGGEVV